MASSVSGLLSGGSSNGASSTGLGQGIDVNSFVQLAESAQTNQITSLQAQVATINNKSSTLGTINVALNALKATAAALNDPLGALNNEIATSSNSSALTANASSTALAGAHTIAITSLATTSSYYSDAVAAGTTALASGDTFTVSAGGTQAASITTSSTVNTLSQIAAAINNQATTSLSDTVATGDTGLSTTGSISVSAGGVQVASVTLNAGNNTLNQIATAINNQTTAVKATVVITANGAQLSIANVSSGDPGALTVNGDLSRADNTAVKFNTQVAVNASVINDANGARLAIVSATSGAPGNLTVTGGLHLVDNTAISLHQASAGLNAVLQVDGVPISSSTNVVSNVINGVTLTLAGPTGNSPVSLTIAPDTSGATTALSNFVAAYNTAITTINAQFNVAADGSGGGALEGDNSLRDAQQQLLGAITFSTGGTGSGVNLTNLGISVNNDGTLTGNSTGLATALSSNYSGVQSFLQGVGGFANNLNTVVGGLTDTISGVLGLDAVGLTQTSQSLSKQITDLQTALAVQTTNLTAVYAQVNATLQELPLLQSQLTQQLASVA